MAFPIANGMALSTAANATSAELISGSWQQLPRGRLTLVARGSATGMNATMQVGPYVVMNDQPIPYFGATGALSINDHVVLSQNVNGGYLSLKIRNTTGGALTTDYQVLFEPAGGK